MSNGESPSATEWDGAGTGTEGTGTGPPVERLRQPNMAELVSSALRAKILARDLADGDVLPKQEELAEQFGTSSLSVREGLRILEGEGLVTVRRGRHGGAIVHTPGAGSAAYMLGLVLQAKKVPLSEIARTLNDLEPMCAGLCAERADRDTSVVPRLRAVQDEAVAERSVIAGTRLGRQFHEELVTGSGRQTMVVLIGVLESIWTAHSEQAVERGILARTPPSDEYLTGRHRDHEELIALIHDGDADGAVLSARRHLESSALYQLGDPDSDRIVEAGQLARYISLLTN